MGDTPERVHTAGRIRTVLAEEFNLLNKSPPVGLCEPA